MPSRNVIREFEAGGYYHVFNRGVEKRNIFQDNQDYAVFLGLLKKYLSGVGSAKKHRHRFENLEGQVELLAYCLMPNHFHLLFYQINENGITNLMRRVMTAYVMYFNDRYSRVGALFQGRYKASRINADDYLHHISRYIHLNPTDFMNWQASSLPYYSGQKTPPAWLKTQKVLELFKNNKDSYVEFLRDYQNNKQELSVLKWQLANDPETDT